MTVRLRKDLFWKAPLLFVAAWLVFAVASMRRADDRLYPARSPGVTVYVVNNGFHTDIALPRTAVLDRGGALAGSAALAGPRDWLVYGWGDQGFFTAKGFSFARAVDGLRALFWPNNPSVIRLYGTNAAPDVLYGREVAMPVVLSRDGFDALARHMEASLRLRQNRPVVALDERDGVYFFSSVEHFSIGRVCNNWTSDQLSAAGLPTTPAIDGLAPLLSLDLRLRAHVAP